MKKIMMSLLVFAALKFIISGGLEARGNKNGRILQFPFMPAAGSGT